MKFLLFNAVVVAALIFLFKGNDWGGGWSTQGPMGSSLSSAAQPAPEPAKPVTPKPLPPNAAPKPKPAPVKQVASAPLAPLAPAVLERRAVVLKTPSPNVTPSQTQFMSKRERRQSLLSMAEDMELLSVEAAAQ